MSQLTFTANVESLANGFMRELFRNRLLINRDNDKGGL